MTIQVQVDPITETASVETAAPETTAQEPASPAPTVPAPRRRGLLWPLIGWTLVAVGILAGTVGRAWVVTHISIDSDQAVAGLMAREILHGHFTAFYWGQGYGGVEPFVVAAVLAVTRQSALSLTLTPAILMAATAVLTWRAALRLVEDRWLAALAGVVVWTVPMFGLTDTTEYGFRNLTLAVGVATLLMSLRILDGRTAVLDVTAFGLLAGIGWWASPEMTFFLVPAIPLFLAAVVGTWPARGPRFWVPRIGATLIGTAIGALPWLWSNIPDGFRSLDASRVTLAGSGGYLSHLRVFFVDVLPLQLGVHRNITGVPLLPGALGLVSVVLVFGALLVSVAVCLFQGGRGRAIAAGVVAFPLLYALNPLGAWWYDGRYSEYLPPLAALIIVMGCERVARLIVPMIRSHTHSRTSAPDRARRVARAGVSLLVAVVLSSAGVGFSWVVKGNPSGVLSANPNASTDREIGILEQHGIRVGYANYWVAYKLDLLSDGALHFSPVPWDQVRSTSIAEMVADTPQPAWLFVPPSAIAAAAPQFGTGNLQTAYIPEQAFVGSLDSRGIPYSIVRAGFFDAVVPQRTMTPRQIAFG